MYIPRAPRLEKDITSLQEGAPDLGKEVFQKDADALKDMDSNMQATARRAIIFEVTETLISDEQIQALDEADDNEVVAGLANEERALKALRR